jgi:hypothetical protein
MSAPVVEGESLRTGGGGQLEIQLECGSAVRLAPDSRLTVARLGRHDDGVAATTVILDQGRFFLSLRRDDTRDLRIQLPGARLDLPRANIRFQVHLGMRAGNSIRVTSGQAQLHVGGTVYTVKKSNPLSWTDNGSVRPLSPASQSDDHWADWSRDRDRAFDRALMAARPRSEFSGAEVHTVPTPAAPPGSRAVPLSVWPILAAGADASLPEPAAPAGVPVETLPACAR